MWINFLAARNAGAFTIYNAGTVSINPNDFDYNSITIQDPVTYSMNGAPVLASRNGRPLYNAGRLSIRDCQALSTMYNCRIQCPTCEYNIAPIRIFS